MVRVWSLAARCAHRALAASVLACLGLHEGGAWHEGLGYAALALACWRSGVGLFGHEPALRFARFVRPPGETLAYAQALLARCEPRHLGHNPLGGWMIVALLASALLAGASGALYVTDRFWGDPIVYAVHQMAGWAFALLVPLHVGGVLVTSVLQRENLIASMFTGRKRAAAPGDVDLH